MTEPKTPSKRPVAAAVENVLSPANAALASAVQHTHLFQGPTPSPEVMERYDALVPGTARRLFELAEAESLHRRKLEVDTKAADIAAREKQLAIAEYQTRAVFRSDTFGQMAGLLVSVSCVAGAVYLAVQGHEWVAGALAAIPTAAVIQAFFSKRHSSSPGK